MFCPKFPTRCRDRTIKIDCSNCRAEAYFNETLLAVLSAVHGGSVERIKGGILRPHGNRVQRTNGNRTMN